MLVPAGVAGFYEKGETIIQDIPPPVDYLLAEAEQSVFITPFFERGCTHGFCPAMKVRAGEAFTGGIVILAKVRMVKKTNPVRFQNTGAFGTIRFHYIRFAMNQGVPAENKIHGIIGYPVQVPAVVDIIFNGGEIAKPVPAVVYARDIEINDPELRA
jgi:hypothetical protein